MVNPWFRLYSEFAHDPKVQIMPEHMQRRLIMLMCLRCCNVLATLHDSEIAFHLRITAPELAETKALFIERGFIEIIEDGWHVSNWDKRQFVSDSSTCRSKKSRQRSRNVAVAQVQQEKGVLDTDTDTEESTIAQNDGEAVVSEPLPPPALVPEKRAESITQAQIIEIYQLYPRRVGAIAAYKAIEKAYRMLRKGGTGRPALDHAAAIALLLSRTKQFSESADGKWAGGEDFRPYPATWFNQGRFLDEAAQKPKRVYVNA
jgi:hypothetical protein